jgi:hypothetical protein
MKKLQAIYNTILSELENTAPSDFVKFHQYFFRNHYLKVSEEDQEFIDSLELDEDDLIQWSYEAVHENIEQKYIDFFNEIGIEAAVKWIGDNDYVGEKELIDFLEGEQSDEVDEYFEDLLFECWAYYDTIVKCIVCHFKDEIVEELNSVNYKRSNTLDEILENID